MYYFIKAPFIRLEDGPAHLKYFTYVCITEYNVTESEGYAVARRVSLLLAEADVAEDSRGRTSQCDVVIAGGRCCVSPGYYYHTPMKAHIRSQVDGCFTLQQMCHCVLTPSACGLLADSRSLASIPKERGLGRRVTAWMDVSAGPW